MRLLRRVASTSWPQLLRACVRTSHRVRILPPSRLAPGTHTQLFFSFRSSLPIRAWALPPLPRPLFIYSHLTNTQKENAKVTTGVSAQQRLPFSAPALQSTVLSTDEATYCIAPRVAYTQQGHLCSNNTPEFRGARPLCKKLGTGRLDLDQRRAGRDARNRAVSITIAYVCMYVCVCTSDRCTSFLRNAPLWSSPPRPAPPRLPCASRV